MLRVLQRIVEAVNQAPDFELALQTMVEQVKTALNLDCCSIYLADREQQHFRLVATDGLTLTSNEPVLIPFGEGVISLAARREEPLNIPNASQHPQFLSLPQVDEERYRAMLVAPVIHRRKLLGVLAVQQEQERAFSADEEAFLVTLAAQLAVVVAHADAKGYLRSAALPSSFMQSVSGLAAAPGVAIATAYVMKPAARLQHVKPRRTTQPESEIRAFRAAVARTRQQLNELSERMRETVAEESLAIFEVYHAMLDSTSLGQQVESTIQQGWRAQTALRQVVEQLVQQFEELDDLYIRERASDVRDLGERILAHLQQRQQQQLSPPQRCILVAEEVTATMLAELPQTDIVGMISLRGSSHSHAAIMARSMGIAAVVGITDIDVQELAGQHVIVDGYTGDVYLNPPAQVEQQYQQLAGEEQALRKKVEQARGLAVATTDGVSVKLQLNVGLHADSEWLRQLDVAGVGLYRTEIPFMMAERFPTENEQTSLYQQVLQQFAPHPVVMRTLDVGGDKPLPYLPLHEDNPFLGWRGIRMTLDQPEIFLIQIRAMLRASIGQQNLQILLPMISSAEEVDDASRLLKQAYYEVSEECGADVELTRPQLGVMIEVPAMIYQLAAVAAKIDFFSVGTNDLTQYLLAVDRNNERVAALYDAYHPAVLQALQHIATQCQQLGKPVSVCGELAGEPAGALLLVAMGYRTLSMNSHMVDAIRWIIRHVSAAQLEPILAAVLAARTPQHVRELMTIEIEKLGLGGFVRAGG